MLENLVNILHLLFVCLSRYLEKYQEKLKKRRRTAEEILSFQQELLKRERALQEEETNISQMIDQALEYFDERKKPSYDTSTVKSAKPLSNTISDDTVKSKTIETTTATERTSATIPEEEYSKSSDIPEELLESSRPNSGFEYNTDTFEEENHLLTEGPLTSTPYHPSTARDGQ